MPYKNPEDQRAAWRRWREKNKIKDRKRIQDRKKKIKQWFKKYKSTLKCNRCPEKHPACLTFHHVDEDKELGVAELVSTGYSKKRILQEISKCEVLCSNCHMKEHWSDIYLNET